MICEEKRDHLKQKLSKLISDLRTYVCKNKDKKEFLQTIKEKMLSNNNMFTYLNFIDDMSFEVFIIIL